MIFELYYGDELIAADFGHPTNNGKTIESYKKGHVIDEFVEWIQTTMNNRIKNNFLKDTIFLLDNSSYYIEINDINKRLIDFSKNNSYQPY
jgi:hypothetical protein